MLMRHLKFLLNGSNISAGLLDLVNYVELLGGVGGTVSLVFPRPGVRHERRNR